MSYPNDVIIWGFPRDFPEILWFYLVQLQKWVNIVKISNVNSGKSINDRNLKFSGNILYILKFLTAMIKALGNFAKNMQNLFFKIAA